MKTEKKESTTNFNYKLESGESKSATVLRLVGEGKNRDEITDHLCSLNPKISRKSNGGTVSNVLKMYGLREAVGRGARSKKTQEEKLAMGKEIIKAREKALNGS